MPLFIKVCNAKNQTFFHNFFNINKRFEEFGNLSFFLYFEHFMEITVDLRLGASQLDNVNLYIKRYKF